MGVPHAVALSKATERLHQHLGGIVFGLMGRGQNCHEAPMIVMESDSTEGPWTSVPSDALVIQRVPIGGANGVEPVLLAAAQNAYEATGFPIEKWNRLQAANPGGNHQRWHAGEVVSGDQIHAVQAAAKLLQLRKPCLTPGPPSPDPREGLETNTPRVSQRAWRREGEIWQLRYNGESASFSDRKGLGYLQRLLANPNPLIPLQALDLMSLAADFGCLKPIDEPVEDAEAARQRDERLKELAARVTTERPFHDAEKVKEWEEEIEVLTQSRLRNVMLNGRGRRFDGPTPAEKARRAVRGCIDREIHHIVEWMPKLAEHLESCIKTEGDGFAYRPGGQYIEWDLGK